jgi:hypothetical protein
VGLWRGTLPHHLKETPLKRVRVAFASATLSRLANSHKNHVSPTPSQLQLCIFRKPVAIATMATLEDATEAQIPASRHEEYQYLDLVREILENGEHRPDRQVLSPLSPTRTQPTKPTNASPRQNRHRHLLPLRPAAPKIHPPLPLGHTDPPPPNHETRLHPRHNPRAPLVHRGRDILPAPVASRRQDLGRQRLARIPRQPGSHPPRSRRPGPRLRVPVAALRGRVRGRQDRLYGQGGRPAGSNYT